MRDRSIAAGTLCSVACTPLRVLVGRLPSIRAKCGLLCPLGPLGPVRTIVCFVSPALIQSSGLVYNTPYQPFDHKAATLDAARRLKHLQTPLFRSVDSAVVSKACTGLIWSLMITKFLSAFLKNLIPVQALDLDAIRQSILDDVEPPPNAEHVEDGHLQIRVQPEEEAHAGSSARRHPGLTGSRACQNASVKHLTVLPQADRIQRTAPRGGGGGGGA